MRRERGNTFISREALHKRLFSLHLVDTAIVTLRERVSRLQGFFRVVSTEPLSTTVQEVKRSERSHRLEQTLEDADAVDLKMEVMVAVRHFSPQISSPFDTLNYIYQQNALDFYPYLSKTLRLTLPV